MINRVLIIMLLASSPAFGQNPVVSGQVKTPKGEPAGSMQVTLTTVSQNPRTSTQTKTNDGGFFRFENVRPGEYTILAGANSATLLPKEIDSEVIVLATPGGGLLRGTGTATATATTVTVAAGRNVDNVSLTLAAGTASWPGPAFRVLPVKFVVEGGGTPTFHSDQFGLLFSDTPANVATTVTFRGGEQKPAKPLTRIERLNQPFLTTSVIPMPSFPGEFKIAIPEGTIRVGQVAPIPTAAHPASHVVATTRTYYYIKSMTFGATDLSKDLMTLGEPARDTLVITFAKCTDKTTQETLCQ